jgi:hypothetical protein
MREAQFTTNPEEEKREPHPSTRRMQSDTRHEAAPKRARAAESPDTDYEGRAAAGWGAAGWAASNSARNPSISTRSHEAVPHASNSAPPAAAGGFRSGREILVEDNRKNGGGLSGHGGSSSSRDSPAGNGSDRGEWYPSGGGALGQGWQTNGRADATPMGRGTGQGGRRPGLVVLLSQTSVLGLLVFRCFSCISAGLLVTVIVLMASDLVTDQLRFTVLYFSYATVRIVLQQQGSKSTQVRVVVVGFEVDFAEMVISTVASCQHSRKRV